MTIGDNKNHMSDENVWFQEYIWPNQSLTDVRITGIFLPDYLEKSNVKGYV